MKKLYSMRVNKNVEDLKVGDLVTSDFYISQNDVVRMIVSIQKDSVCGSGYRASADAGKPCKVCHRVGSVIMGVDASWFVKYEK